MKVIALHYDETQLISLAIANNRQAQHQLYTKYASKMLSVCRQYIKDMHHAEDVMLSAFIKVFTNLKKFENRGNFEGWIKRIMINECIDFLRNKKNTFSHIELEDWKTTEEEEYDGEVFSTEIIQELIDNLPTGYKMVFNLYVIEGFKHQEIAKMLQIAEGTSKSQLAHARKMLQEGLKNYKNIQNGTT